MMTHGQDQVFCPNCFAVGSTEDFDQCEALPAHETVDELLDLVGTIAVEFWICRTCSERFEPIG